MRVVYEVSRTAVPSPPEKFRFTGACIGGSRDGRARGNLKLCHARLGHAKVQSIISLVRRVAVSGFENKTQTGFTNPCPSCVKGKQAKQELRENRHRSDKKVTVIHSDVSGPMSVQSFSGTHYFLTFIDEYSGYIVCKPIASKSYVAECFKSSQKWFGKSLNAQ